MEQTKNVLYRFVFPKTETIRKQWLYGIRRVVTKSAKKISPFMYESNIRIY